MYIVLVTGNNQYLAIQKVAKCDKVFYYIEKVLLDIAYFKNHFCATIPKSNEKNITQCFNAIQMITENRKKVQMFCTFMVFVMLYFKK